MRVDPSGTHQPIPQTTTGTPVRPAVRTPEAASSSLDGAAFALTAQLAQLLATVRTTPEVRADVVEAVAARLEAGELATPEAAAETARAMLDAASAE